MFSAHESKGEASVNSGSLGPANATSASSDSEPSQASDGSSMEHGLDSGSPGSDLGAADDEFTDEGAAGDDDDGFSDEEEEEEDEWGGEAAGGAGQEGEEENNDEEEYHDEENNDEKEEQQQGADHPPDDEREHFEWPSQEAHEAALREAHWEIEEAKREEARRKEEAAIAQRKADQARNFRAGYAPSPGPMWWDGVAHKFLPAQPQYRRVWVLSKVGESCLTACNVPGHRHCVGDGIFGFKGGWAQSPEAAEAAAKEAGVTCTAIEEKCADREYGLYLVPKEDDETIGIPYQGEATSKVTSNDTNVTNASSEGENVTNTSVAPGNASLLGMKWIKPRDFGSVGVCQWCNISKVATLTSTGGGGTSRNFWRYNPDCFRRFDDKARVCPCKDWITTTGTTPPPNQTTDDTNTTVANVNFTAHGTTARMNQTLNDTSTTAANGNVTTHSNSSEVRPLGAEPNGSLGGGASSGANSSHEAPPAASTPLEGSLGGGAGSEANRTQEDLRTEVEEASTPSNASNASSVEEGSAPSSASNASSVENGTAPALGTASEVEEAVAPSNASSASSMENGSASEVVNTTGEDLGSTTASETNMVPNSSTLAARTNSSSGDGAADVPALGNSTQGASVR